MPISEGESDLVLTKAERDQLLRLLGQLYDACSGLTDCIGIGRSELWADAKSARQHLRVVSMAGATMNAVLYSSQQLQRGLFAVHQAKEEQRGAYGFTWNGAPEDGDEAEE